MEKKVSISDILRARTLKFESFLHSFLHSSFKEKFFYVSFNLLFEYFILNIISFLFILKLIIFPGKESVEGHSRICS